LEVKEDDDEAKEEGEEKPKKTKEVTTFDWERLNGNPAIWTRPKEEITDEEYQNFYKVLTKNEYMDAGKCLYEVTGFVRIMQGKWIDSDTV
jgi:heat shock protein beta